VACVAALRILMEIRVCATDLARSMAEPHAHCEAPSRCTRVMYPSIDATSTSRDCSGFGALKMADR